MEIWHKNNILWRRACLIISHVPNYSFVFYAFWPFKQLESEMATDKKRTLNHSIYVSHSMDIH